LVLICFSIRTTGSLKGFLIAGALSRLGFEFNRWKSLQSLSLNFESGLSRRRGWRFKFEQVHHLALFQSTSARHATVARELQGIVVPADRLIRQMEVLARKLRSVVDVVCCMPQAVANARMPDS
jgi:hypothetical protein